MSTATPSFHELAVAGVRNLQPYQPGKPMSELQREYGLSEGIKLASNENPLGPGQRATEAARGALAEMHRYPDGNGFELKTALSAFHDVAPARITLGNGSNDVLALVAATFLGPGCEAVFSEHAFAVYPIVTSAVGASARVAPACGRSSAMPFGHDLDALAAAITDATRVVFVANPNNPTGTWIASEALYAFLQAVPREVIVVVDEAYCEYAPAGSGPEAVEWLDTFPNLVVTRTFSKVHGLAGLRVGYALSHPEVADLMNRARQPFNVNAAAQAAACAALNDREYVAESVRLNNEQRDWLDGELRGLGLEVLPSRGNFLCARVGDSAAVYEGLLREGLIVRPVDAYGLPGFLRISIGLPGENRRLVEALGRVLEATP